MLEVVFLLIPDFTIWLKESDTPHTTFYETHSRKYSKACQRQLFHKTSCDNWSQILYRFKIIRFVLDKSLWQKILHLGNQFIYSVLVYSFKLVYLPLRQSVGNTFSVVVCSQKTFGIGQYCFMWYCN